MKDQCQWEGLVVRAIRSQPLPDELAEHVSECELCRTSASVALSLLALATESVPDRTAGASLLWLVARERRAQHGAVRIQFTMLGTVFVIMATLTLAAWRLQLLSSGSNAGGIVAALIIGFLVVNWFASDEVLSVYS